MAKCRFDPRCYLFYPARLTLRETLSGSLSRPVLLREKLGLSAWLSAFLLTTLSLSYPARLTLREILYRVSSRPVLISWKKHGLMRLLAVSLFWHHYKNFLYPARLTLREKFQGFLPGPSYFAGKRGLSRLSAVSLFLPGPSLTTAGKMRGISAKSRFS